jgi:hypothetical protein
MNSLHFSSDRQAKRDRRSSCRACAWIYFLMFVGVIGACATACGQMVIDADTVIDAGNSIPNSGIEVIDGDNPPTVVDVVEGGNVATGSRSRSEVFGSNIMNVSGGRVYQVTTFNSSTLNFSGGEVFSHDDDSIGAWDNSTVNISGGIVGVSDDEDFHAVHANESSVVNITGGEIFGDDEGAIAVNDLAVVNISGGHIYDKSGQPAVAVDFGGLANISGGVIDGISIEFGGSANISGGNVGFIFASGEFVPGESPFLLESFVLLSGGSVQSLRAADFSIIEVHGSNLVLDEGRLTGLLADGSRIDAAAEVIGSGQILLVPETSTLTLLLIGSLVASRSRKSRVNSRRELLPKCHRV